MQDNEPFKDTRKIWLVWHVNLLFERHRGATTLIGKLEGQRDDSTSFRKRVNDFNKIPNFTMFRKRPL
jgi:hypothetical protein